MAAVSLFWDTNMAAVTSSENTLFINHVITLLPAPRAEGFFNVKRLNKLLSSVNFYKATPFERTHWEKINHP